MMILILAVVGYIVSVNYVLACVVLGGTAKPGEIQMPGVKLGALGGTSKPGGKTVASLPLGENQKRGYNPRGDDSL